jgi:RimJ/RimL family protein N-acetyltransferase
MVDQISVKPTTIEHYENIVQYFVDAEQTFLNGMGVDPNKLPTRESWLKTLHDNHSLPIKERSIFYVIWYLDGEAIGHCNINKIIFGSEAYMHLHMWRPEIRKAGLGSQFVRKSIPFFFEAFSLRVLYCEPYALNPAPNKTLTKLGFEFVRNYETTPGIISFPQSVNRWQLTEERFKSLF